MILWIDAQLSPNLAPWITEIFGVGALAIRDAGLRDASDHQIYLAARDAGAVVVTKDSDFLHLVEQHSSPPQILWNTCGNTSTVRLKQVLQSAMPQAMRLMDRGEPVVEISDAR